MQKFFLMAGLVLLLFPFTALGQSTPKVELFGGYSYLRADGDGDPSANLHGWNASIAGNMNNWLGLVADFSGHYGSESLSFVLGPVDFFQTRADDSTHAFLFGPRVSYRKHNKVTPFVHTLIGAVHDKVDNITVITARVGNAAAGTLPKSISETAFGLALGGGLDVKATDRIAVRLVQADYLLTRFHDDSQHNLRLSFGLVLRLGQK